MHWISPDREDREQCCARFRATRFRVQAESNLSLKSNSVLVVDQDTGESLVSKNADVTVPIASLTKLMTALVVVDARQPMDEMLEITSDDVDPVWPALQFTGDDPAAWCDLPPAAGNPSFQATDTKPVAE